MTDLYKRIAELAEKYRPLAVEMLKEVIRIPADYVAENPKCGLSNGEKERLTYLKNKIVEIGAVRSAKDVDFDGFGNLVWTVEDVNDGIPSPASRCPRPKSTWPRGHFAAGSMKPKVQAIIEYLENGGGSALITAPPHIVDAFEGRTGTWFVQDDA